MGGQIISRRRGRKTISKDLPASRVEWVKKEAAVLIVMKNIETSVRKECWQPKKCNGKV
jgi:hypothetical protein